MLNTTQHIKHFKIIECTLFLFLCGLSVVFINGVLNKFISRKTSFTQSEAPITELPTVVVCFTNPNSKKTYYEYGTDFDIVYRIEAHTDIYYPITVGKNSAILGEILYLDKIITRNMGNCYKFTSESSSSSMIKTKTEIILHFNESLMLEDLPSVKVFLSSEDNVYGVIFNQWYNGIVMKTDIIIGRKKSVQLKQEQYSYLTSNFKCSLETAYGCFGKLLLTHLNGSTSPCSEFSLPHIPICKIDKTDEENSVFWNIYDMSIPQCFKSKKLCNTTDYLGMETYHGDSYNHKHNVHKNRTISFKYSLIPNFATIYEEYLIYDFISMIGSVGGTLGMCIGFSFTGVISSLINFLQYGYLIIKKRLSYKKISKSNSQNDSIKIETIQVKGQRDFDNYSCKINKYYDLKHEEYLKGLEKLEEKLNAELKKVIEENSMKFKNIEWKINRLK